ncbi:pullulanase-type alpha-1,6-glucosidase [Spirillospora sp. NPDC029432]|uniref:pullulanase-type alpha-1,6-glucosidase n=1 Tax=Spirillospora sp. NPDC029432 TaxID=3154599 RepID=UPI003452498B
MDRPALARLAAALTALAAILLAPAAALAGTKDGMDTDLSRSRAHWIDRATLAWNVPPDGRRRYELVTAPGGDLRIENGDLAGERRVLRLSPVDGGLAPHQRARWPHLASYAAYRIDPRDAGTVPEALRGRLAVVERDAGGRLLRATGVQIPGVLDDVYASAATRAGLGPVWRGGTPELSVWAPTARDVALDLDGRVLPMRRDGTSGVWTIRGAPEWKGLPYAYRVTVYAPAAGRVVTNVVTDPYGLGLTADSERSLLVDLEDRALAPAGWKSLRKPRGVARPSIYELHVRDFSAADRSVPEGLRGTYGAFGLKRSDGMRALRGLARDGLSYVHLLPVFDFGSVPERRSGRREPGCDLASFPADSEKQQECVGAVRGADAFNWGYDPLHYTVPEGSYASDPDGTARIREFRGMVAGLNRAGLRVVMDVVYNHAYAAGQDPRSVLDRIVPGYYHRLLEDGTVATSTCCPNTAPEHAMMDRLVVDSVVTWARHYKVDGFRFDLMGHHPKANILRVRAALDRLTPERDGVDGRSIVLYGEGWDFGEVAGHARFEQATQAAMAGTGVATFNDRLRDAVRGGGPFDADPRAQGFGSGLWTAPNGSPANGAPDEQRARLLRAADRIKVGLTGNLRDYRFTASDGRTVTGADIDYNGAPTGYTAAPAEAVTYVDAHDNETLYDALAYKLPPETPMADRVRMHALSLATVLLAQGTPFVHAGTERLRSKSLDRNSYDSGDWFNRLHWDCRLGNGFGAGLPPAWDNRDKWPYARPLLASPDLGPGCADIEAARARTGELLRVRESSPLFTLPTAAEVRRRLSFPLSGEGETPGVITYHLDGRGLDPRWTSVTVVLNAAPEPARQTLPALEGAGVRLHPVQAGSPDPVVREASFDRATGTFTVPGRTAAVFVQD